MRHYVLQRQPKQTRAGMKSTSNAIDVTEQTGVLYPKEIFKIQDSVGAKFIPKFIKANGLEALQNKVLSVAKEVKDKTGKAAVISVCSEKGGVGKTTIAISISQLLANLGAKVLLVDTDNLELSHNLTSNRAQMIYEVISAAQENQVPVATIQDQISNMDAVVDSVQIDIKAFNSFKVDELVSNTHYDYIIIDSAGRKDKKTRNFDLKRLTATDSPHITTAYVSNAIIIPMKPTNIDMNAVITYYVPLFEFLTVLRISKNQVIDTKIRVLPSMVEAKGTGLVELANFKEQIGFEFYGDVVRRSEKIANTISDTGIETLYTTRVAGGVLGSIFKITDELLSDVQNSVK